MRRKVTGGKPFGIGTTPMCKEKPASNRCNAGSIWVAQCDGSGSLGHQNRTGLDAESERWCIAPY